MITVGRIIRASTSTADMRFAPPVNWWVSEPLKRISSSLYISGFRIRIPKRPYMTEGIPANSSTAGRTMPQSLGGATSAKKTAVITPIGTPIRMARKVPTIEVKIT